MARDTLKLPKPLDPAATERKPKTTRARDAQRRRHAGLTNPPPVEAKPPQAEEPRPRDRGREGKPPHAKDGYKRAHANDAAKRPFVKDAAKRPFEKDNGKRPFGKDKAKRPFGKSSGRGAFEKDGGKRPFGKDSGKPPFAKDAASDRKSPRGKPPHAKPPHEKPPRSEAIPQPPAERQHQRRARAPTESAPRPAPAPAPRPTNEDTDPRLSKLMGERGLCSRREADEWIENGWVKVDGRVVTELGTRVRRDARIEVEPAAARHQAEQVTILLHKPVGYVSGQPEDDHPPAMVLLTPDNRWPEDPAPIEFKRGHLRGLAPAGRLDIDSTGLLVFTQDGRIAKRLVGGDSEVEKEYLVRVEGTLDEAGLERLRHGLELDGVKLKPAKVSWANEDQLRFVLREGRKRQIRRMCEMVGLRVTGLKRVRSGGVPLGKLPVGQWRYLRRDEKF